MWTVKGTINGKLFIKIIQQREDPNQHFVIGRREGDIVYSDDRRVSRTHAQINIVLRGQNNSERALLFITDLSRFGTTVNGQKITKNEHIGSYE